MLLAYCWLCYVGDYWRCPGTAGVPSPRDGRYSIPPARATCAPVSPVHAVPEIPSCRTSFSQCQFLCCCLSNPQPPSTPQPTHPRTHTCCTTASPPSTPTPPPRTRLRRSTSPRSCPDPNLSGNDSPVQARRRTTTCPAPRASLRTRS
jgi:hypothetical protein